MDDQQAQLTDRLKAANNILVTVSRDPSADQLAACIGLTLLLNKQNKHAAAVFSGEVPSTIEFLNPGETLEKNTDSLRDFIIALDKNKADKLRYKVEDDVVRIFITPYKTSINEQDLDFSQGDFNVDLVVALGVRQQEDLDEAITAHGRILHDATVASINTGAEGGVGSINWHVPQASSLSEVVTQLAQSLGENLLDEQIATALLTGIVAETDRFRNEKTSPATMSAGAALMSAGANQQLVASKLEEANQPAPITEDKDGGIAIDHDDGQPVSPEPALELPTPEIVPEQPTPAESQPAVTDGPQIMTEPPALGSPLTANAQPEPLEPVTDPLSMPQEEAPQLMDHQPATLPATDSPVGAGMTPPPLNWTPPASPAPSPDPGATLTQLEESVGSPHVNAEEKAEDKEEQEEQEEQVDEARDEVSKALSDSVAQAPSPIAALNAQPLGDDLRAAPPPPLETPAPVQAPAQVSDPTAPPPVPPPIPFQFGNPQPPQ